jgi:O-antigen/teichoic acid export membrane protein
VPETLAPDLTPQVAEGVRWTTLQQAAEQIARLAFAVVLARLVSPADFGLMSMAFLVAYLAILVSDLGVGAALVQRREVRPAHVSTAFTVSSLFGIALAVLTVAVARPLAAFFGEPRLAAVLAVVSLTFVCKGVQGVPRDLLRRSLYFVPYTAAAAIALAAGIVVGVVAAVMGAGVWALVLYTTVESVAGMVLSLLLAWRAGVWSPAIGVDRCALREIGGFAGYMVGARGLVYAQNTADNVVVGRMLGTTALGFYGLAYRTMLVPVQKIADIVTSVSMPALAMMQDDEQRLRAAYLRCQRAAALVSFPLSFGVVATSPLAVPALLGARWTPAVSTVQVLALNGPRVVIGRLVSALLQATGRPGWDFWLLGASVPISIAAFIVGARHGIVGVAVGVTVAGTLVFAGQLVLAARTLRTSVVALIRSVRSILAASAAMVCAVVLLQAMVPGTTPQGITLTGTILLGAVVYLGTLVLIDSQLLIEVASDVFRRRPAPTPTEAVALP